MQHSDSILDDILTAMEETRKKRGVNWVQLVRWPGLSDAPVFWTFVDWEGHIEHHRLKCQVPIEKYHGSITTGYFDRLIDFVEAVGFWEFDNVYNNWEMVTDLPSYQVTVSLTSKTKQVVSYGESGPPALWAIAGLIDCAFHQAMKAKNLEDS